MHPDARTHAALQAGELRPDEARALSELLEGACAQGEPYLTAQMNVDPLDGLTDAVIARALPAVGGEGNDLEFARIERALRRAAKRWRRTIAPAAIAASLLLAGVAGIVANQERERSLGVSAWDGTKGHELRAIPVRLRFLKLEPGGQFDKGISGDTVSASSSLIFEVEAGRAADLALARVSPGGAAEIVWRQRVAAGPTQVAVDGRPAAYPLSGLAGAHRFVLIASDAELDDAHARSAAAALAPPRGLADDAPELDGLSLDVVDVSVH